MSRSNSEQSVDNDANIYDSTGSVSTNVPDDILHIKQEKNASSSSNEKEFSPNAQQSMPINLTNEHGKVKNESELHGYASNLDESMEISDYPHSACKIGM